MTATAKHAYYIKLGRGGEWEDECLRDGTIRFGYRETPHKDCTAGAWDRVRDFWTERRGDAGTAARDTNQIRAFYEADEDDLFITFAHGLLHWCRPAGPVEVLPDGGRRRATAHGWSSQSTSGASLSSDRISGHLLKVQMFRGTICLVKPFDYLLRKLNDELSPEVVVAEVAERALMEAITGLMRLLTWQDFELLVDLVFSTSGWRRVGVAGRTQKTVDLELILPTTGERAFVQVKSQASNASLKDYRARFDQADLYDRMFFVWHTGTVTAEDDFDGITLVGPERLSRMVLDAGLSSWLREKVS
ncbi:hypothetical protein [uncultured Parvibaculum sp.]|uniref:hypothetical protein n=1 Tax=uncultured Parvibaculum sp. TaxID=291828 RepID=UPI0030D95891|tara:strand:+ start:35052 stop:35963 length:912 start_codon:yes stop_codon:yes gene_type:complete